MTAETAILVVGGAVFAIVAVSGRLPNVWLTEPLVAMMIGVVIGALIIEPIDIEHPVVLTFLELTLALVLYGDAARIDVGRLRRDYTWPTRMLLVGLPLAMLGGAFAAGWLLGVPFSVALLVGVILAPTDAALAEPVLDAEKLPVRIRQTLNIESGLNDGLALPALLIAVGLVGAGSGGEGASAVGLVLRQVGLGAAGGVLFGLGGALVIGNGTRNGWMSPRHQKIAAVALALIAFASVQIAGGSGFVGTFVAGAVLGARVRPRCEYLYEFARTEGRALVLIAFLLLGAGPLNAMLQSGVEPEVWLLALLALFVIRPVAIAISLIGESLMLSTAGFLGWFGPRGLATIVFMLVAFEELDGIPVRLLDLVVLTVALSAVLHGVSATPVAGWLARKVESQGDHSMPEMGEGYEHPTRSLSPPSPD